LSAGGLLCLWMGLDLPSAWVLAGWCAAAGVALGFGALLRCREVRAVGSLLALLPLWAVCGGPALGEVVREHPVWPLGGWIAVLALYAGAAWHYQSGRSAEARESEVMVPLFAAGAALTALRWSWLALGPGWVSAAWLGVT